MDCFFKLNNFLPQVYFRGSNGIKVHSKVFALSHIPYTRKLVVFIGFLCKCVQFCLKFNLEGSVINLATGVPKRAKPLLEKQAF